MKALLFFFSYNIGYHYFLQYFQLYKSNNQFILFPIFNFIFNNVTFNFTMTLLQCHYYVK